MGVDKRQRKKPGPKGDPGFRMSPKDGRSKRFRLIERIAKAEHHPETSGISVVCSNVFLINSFSSPR